MPVCYPQIKERMSMSDTALPNDGMSEQARLLPLPSVR